VAAWYVYFTDDPFPHKPGLGCAFYQPHELMSDHACVIHKASGKLKVGG